MPYRMSLSVGAVAPMAAAPIAAPVAAPAGGGCSVAYGPVANVCQSMVPVTQMVPVTRVTPIPNTVAPAMAVGQPVSAAPYGMGKGVAAPYGAGKGAMMPYGAAMPWTQMTTTGVAPGIYTSDVAMPYVV